jgi:hypothetical protein
MISKVVTNPCPFCGIMEMVDVPTEGLQRWQGGELIQVALPDLSIELRELLISGTHLVCWDLHMGEDDED